MIGGLIFAAVAIGILEEGSLIDYEMIASLQKRRYVQLYLAGGRTASSDTLSTSFGVCDSFIDLPAPLRLSDGPEVNSLNDYGVMIPRILNKRYAQLYLTGGRTASSDTLSTSFGICDSFIDLPAPLRLSDSPGVDSLNDYGMITVLEERYVIKLLLFLVIIACLCAVAIVLKKKKKKGDNEQKGKRREN